MPRLIGWRTAIFPDNAGAEAIPAAVGTWAGEVGRLGSLRPSSEVLFVHRMRAKYVRLSKAHELPTEMLAEPARAGVRLENM